MIAVRKSTFDDNGDFAELMLISAPYFPILFGKKIKTILQDLFCYPSNLFSFEHAHFAEVDGKTAGMILGYDWNIKKHENLRMGFLLFKKIGAGMLVKFFSLIKFNSTVGKLNNDEYYISNIAVYSNYRRMSIGKKLMVEIEYKAKMAGAKKIVLDVEKDNIGAITFYKKLGYEIIKEFSIPLKKEKILYFHRMIKEVK
jgi:ribosomal protein S18 acetylase RimI-like enzyme